MRIALPNKGPLCEPTLRLLAEAGFGALDKPEASLCARCTDTRIEFLYARVGDIPAYVASGAAYAGITGADMLAEKGAKVRDELDLEFGKCEVALAVPEGSGIRDIGGLEGKRIATKLPNIARRYLQERKAGAEIVELSGATEIAPSAGMADAIIDHVETGRTLAANRLVRIETLMRSSARLIATTKNDAASERIFEEIALALRGVLSARGLKYLVFNAPSPKVLQAAIAAVPAMESPTVLKLAKRGEWAVQTVVKAGQVAGVVRAVKEAGGKDILVMPLEKVIA